MALFNFLPREEQYFALFTEMTAHICEAARALVVMLDDSGGDYTHHATRIKSIEHQCDELTHSIVMKLNKSFITPFEREDIYLLSGALDDIVDLIDGVAKAMRMYDLHASTSHARNFASVIERMSLQLHEIVSMLERPRGVSARLVEMHRLENEGDDIYHLAVGELFRNATDPLTVIKWKEIYERLEAAVDRCENAATILESVIIKNA